MLVSVREVRIWQAVDVVVGAVVLGVGALADRRRSSALPTRSRFAVALVFGARDASTASGSSSRPSRSGS